MPSRECKLVDFGRPWPLFLAGCFLLSLGGLPTGILLSLMKLIVMRLSAAYIAYPGVQLPLSLQTDVSLLMHFLSPCCHTIPAFLVWPWTHLCMHGSNMWLGGIGFSAVALLSML